MCIRDSKKRELAITFGELVYDGQWFSPLRKALSAFVTSTQEHVTGKVRLEPVSYTHLDVYKRQVVDHTTSKCYPCA